METEPNPFSHPTDESEATSIQTNDSLEEITSPPSGGPEVSVASEVNQEIPAPLAIEEEHTELTPEQVIENLQQQLLETFEQAGIPITAERWQQLLPEISYLNDTEFKQQPAMVEAAKKNYGKFPERINALVNRDGHVVVSEHFLKLNEVQQQHVLAHEASHRLSWFLERSESTLYQEIAKSIDSLHSSEVSLYVAYIEKSYQERKKAGKETMSETELTAKLHEEKSAEILAQYLTAQGKFGKMMRSKFLKFSNDGSELAAWLEQPGAGDLLNDLGRFDQEPAPSEEELEGFFAKCPELRAHHKLYLQLHQLFTSQGELDTAFEQVDQYSLMDGEFLEYNGLTEPYPIQPAEINRSPRPETVKATSGPNLFNFLFYGAVSN